VARGGFSKLLIIKGEKIMHDKELNILVIDDNEGIRDSLKTYLTQLGHTVALATNAQEALTKFDAGHFDVVITDSSLPLGPETGVGAKIAKAIKLQSPDVPVLMVSGDQKDKPENVDALLAKPFRLEAISAFIEQSTSPK